MGVKLPANADFVIQIHTPQNISTGPSYGMDIGADKIILYPENVSSMKFFLLHLYNIGKMIFILNQMKLKFYTSSDSLESNLSLYNTLPHSHKICTEILNYASDGNDTIPIIKIDQWDLITNNIIILRIWLRFHILIDFFLNINMITQLKIITILLIPKLITVGLNSNDEMLFDSFQILYYEEGDENINIDSILKMIIIDKFNISQYF